MKSRELGQTLVALLAFMSTAFIITVAATTVTLVNLQASSKYTFGQDALAIAEAGMDNAMLRILRDPNYTGETLTVGSGTATITVSGSSPKTVTSQGRSGDFRRTVQATVTLTNNTLTITNWSETP